jgi:hypothetical protein
MASPQQQLRTGWRVSWPPSSQGLTSLYLILSGSVKKIAFGSDVATKNENQLHKIKFYWPRIR